MKNIKAIELTKSAFGLPAGIVLSRLSNDEPFSYKSEHIGDEYQFSSSLSVSPTMIDWDFCAPTEWFEQERRSSKHVISELKREIERLSEDAKVSAEIIKDAEKYNKLIKRATDKRTEFQLKLNQLELDLENDIIAGESIEWADEAMTVYYNLIDLINKLLDE